MTLNRIFSALYRKAWYFFYKSKFKELGKNTFIKRAIIITPAHISLSQNVFIQHNSRIEGITNYEGINFQPNIIIKENCTIQQNLHLTCAGNVFIGKNTAIAANVTITDINHPYERIDLPIERQPIIVTPVYIDDDCKIYNNAVILPGTKIGKHCVVGANSVVFGSIPDYCIVAGSPGRIIKRYCFEKKEWLKTDKEGDFIKETYK
jgi:acetyltransferase-like isoleucine patch superfamily enzyme